MKTINKISIVVLGLAALSATSCSDKAFDKYPTDSMQMETYVRNDTEAQNVLYDAYYHLRNNSQNIIYINSLATDEAYNNKRNNSNDHTYLNECLWDSTFGISGSIWSASYSLINRCNTVIDNAQYLSEAGKKQLVNEAKFLRAHAYFNLVRLFGPVPLTTSVIGNYKDLYSYKRESVDNVYAQIVLDLNDAIANLPEGYTDPAKAGRATKIAAQTVLADVQMTRGDYASAKKTLEFVIDYAEKNPSKLGLEDDVRRIYDSANPIGKEIIFAAQYNNGATQVTNYFMQAGYPSGLTPNQPIYIYPDGTEFTINTGAGAGTMMMTWDLWNALRKDPKDKRISLVYSGLYDTATADKASAEVEVKTVASGATHAYLPSSLKYFDFDNQGETKTLSGCDNIIYRYAGVLLKYAECLNETGDTPGALTYLNKVRARAGVDPATASSKEQMREVIEQENYLELHLEGHRWFDLLRTGRLTAVMEKHYAHRTPGLSAVHQANNNGMVVTDANAATGTPAQWKWSTSNTPILFPVPYDQIQLTDWDQNDGY